jgi:hypothetical protein
MKINKDSLATRARNIIQRTGATPESVYARFFFDAFVIRISKSRYSDFFILKGGLLLSNIFGLSARTTVDLDFLVVKQRMELGNLVSILKEIADIDVGDGVVFIYTGYEEMAKEDLYGGYSLKFLARFANIRFPVFD